MTKKIVLLIITMLPILVIGQEDKSNRSIEINAGHANYNYNLNGTFLSAGYSRNFNKYIGLTGSLTLANGSRNKDNSFVNDQFHASALQFGVTGVLDFLKIHSLKLTGIAGYCFLEKTEVLTPNNLPVSTSYLKPCFTTSFHYTISLNDKFHLGLIYSRALILSSIQSKGKLNTSGISLAYQF